MTLTIRGARRRPDILYIEQLADYWGELCGSIEIASAWADRLIGVTRLALSPDKNVRGYFHGTSACLSALFAAERYDELIALVQGDIFWSYKRWAVKALIAQGRNAEAIGYAESCRNRGRAIGTSTGYVNRYSGHRGGSTRRMLAMASRRTGRARISGGFEQSRRNTRASHPVSCCQILFG